NPLVDFGPNEWIVEDMYQRYVADPTSVDAAWHEFFADYRPAVDGAPTATDTPSTATRSPAAKSPAAKSPAAAPAAPVAAPNGGEVKTATKPATRTAAKPAAAPVPTGAKVTVLRGVAARIVA